MISPFSPDRPAAVLALLLLGAASLAEAQQRFEFTELHMGGAVTITLYSGEEERARRAARAAFDRIAEIENVLSDYRPGSEASRLAAQGTDAELRVSNDLCRVMAAALDMAEASEGAFDPTIGPLVALWRRSRAEGVLPTDREVAESKARTGWRAVRLDRPACTVRLAIQGMRLDFGGIGKGYALDEAGRVLRDHGMERWLMGAGGDILAGPAPPGRGGWEVAVREPGADPSLKREAVRLRNAALSTSGGSEQYGEIGGRRYAHIVDPATGAGLTDRIEVSVIASSATLSDAAATAVAAAGPSIGEALRKRFPGIRLISVRRD